MIDKSIRKITGEFKLDAIKNGLPKGDIEILSSIAEHKTATSDQLQYLLQRSIQTIRRRLRHLSKNQMISERIRLFGNGPGRKEKVFLLLNKGLTVLETKGVLSKHALYITDDKSRGLHCLEHDLLLNWFLIYLIQIQRLNSRFKVNYITTSSHTLTEGNPDEPFFMERFSSIKDPEKIQTIIPDGVFTITDRKSNKSLLFFIEVDMSTETLISGTLCSDIQTKIRKYQSLFQQEAYKKYNELFDFEFNGFRTLFLANTEPRLKSLCNVIKSTPPSDFIWLTSQNNMFKNGLAAEIWARGGQYNKPRESILGPWNFKAIIESYNKKGAD